MSHHVVRLSTVTGLALTTAGCTGIALLWVFHEEYRNRIEISVSSLAIAVGVFLVLFAYMIGRGRDVEEAYRLGYDVGYEKGFSQAEHVTAARP